ncbi:MAG: DEAD/DEAH box helicase [Desulfobacterales bacterium]|nr:DEAD/DEAH box helicase [Desulfobacterales bacterium]
MCRASTTWCARRWPAGCADETRVVYVSPLKALSNDIQQQPASARWPASARELRSAGPAAGGRSAAAVRTGDTPQRRARARMRRRPPHILVTTPESLYILLSSASRAGACWPAPRSVIVDEIHALAPTKRGAHLALSLERLDALAGRRADPHRPVGHAEADRRGGALPGGRRRESRRRRGRAAPSSTPATPATATWRSKLPRRAARSGDVGRGLGARSTTGWPS